MSCSDQLRAEGRDHLVEDMLCAMEEVWGVRFDDGINPELQYLNHLQVRQLPAMAACIMKLGYQAARIPVGSASNWSSRPVLPR